MIIRHSAIYLGATGFAGLINLAALLIYTRLLGPDAFGIFASTYAAVGLVNSLLYWWLRLAIVRFMPEAGVEPGKLTGTVAVCFAGATLVASIIAVGAWLLLRGYGGVTHTLFLSAFAVLISQGIFEVVLEFKRAKLEAARYGLLLIARATVSLLAGAGTAVIWRDPVAIFIGLLAGYAAGSILSVARLTHISMGFSFDRMLAVSMFRFGAPLSIKFASDIWILASGRLAVLAYAGTAATGAYSAGLDLAQQTIGFVVAGIYLACYPLLVRAQEESGLHATMERFASFRILLMATTLPMLIGVWILDGHIVGVAFDAGYASLSGTLPMLAIAVLVLAVKSHYLDLTFQLSKETRKQIGPSVACALIATVAQVILTPRYGIEGAVTATIAAGLIGAGFSWWQGGRHVAVLSLGRDDFKVLLAIAMMVVLVWIGQSMMHAVSAFVVAAVLYVGALSVMNVLDVQRHVQIAARKFRSISKGA